MKISIHLPNYNHARYLEECVESICAQTYRNWELVVVDDGSTDGSWGILERYVRRDSRIIARRFPENRGIHAAEEYALTFCSGDLLHPRASDNPLVSPAFFEKVVKAFTKYPDAAIVFALTNGIDESGRIVTTWGAPQQKNEYVSPEQATKEFFLSDYVAGEAIVQRRSLFIQHGGYDQKLGPYLDLYINEALPALYGGIYLDEVVSHTRLDVNSFSRRQTIQAMTEQSALMEKKFRSLPLKTPPLREWIVQYRERKLTQILMYQEQQALANTLAQISTNLGGWPANRMPGYLSSVRAQLATLSNVIREDCQANVASVLALYDGIAGPVPGP